MKNVRCAALSLVALTLVLPRLAEAQWMTQRIDLAAGWNAIHLKVNPVDRACSAVFGESGIEEVSWWNRDRLSDGTSATVADFANWYPSNGAASTFSRVIGDQRYLVKATRTMSLYVIGTPVLPKGTIYLGEYNLVGMNVPNSAGTSAPTYYECFEPLAGAVAWYGVTSSGDRLRMANSAKAQDASKAVWLEVEGSGITGFTGPFQLSLDGSGDTLNWADDPSRARSLAIKNVSSKDRVLKIGRISSLEPPSGQRRCVGNVALSLESVDWSDGYAKRVYTPISFPFTTNLAAGATFDFRVKPNLSAMPNNAGGDYMSILEISDQGSTLDGELRPFGTCLYRVGVSSAGTLAANEMSSLAGLWVGTVVLDKVSRAQMLSSALPDDWDAEEPVTAPHQFQFRFIVHVDASGVTRVLKQVFTAKRSADADHSDLLTDRDTAIAYRGLFPNATIRRTASANFPFMEPLELAGGTFMAGGATLSATFTQPYYDKTNPFVHVFHPQHDNLEFRNGTPYYLPSGDDGDGEYESWGVTRTISLKFNETDPANAAGESWNRTVTGGEYKETILGINGYGKPIHATGIFRLSKVNDTPTLTTEVIH